MLDEKKIQKLIDEAMDNMALTKNMLGKEVYQKRFKPVYEGYITALSTVLEIDEDTRTENIKGRKL